MRDFNYDHQNKEISKDLIFADVCQLMNEVDKKHPTYHDQFMNLLKFILGTGLNSFTSSGIYPSQADLCLSVRDYIVKNLICGKDGIIGALRELNNCDYKYLDLFFESTKNVIEIANLETTANNQKSFLSGTYIFNIYTMLRKMYQSQYDYNTFKCVIDDVKDSFIGYDIYNLGDFKLAIDLIALLPFYEEIPALRELLKNQFKYYNCMINTTYIGRFFEDILKVLEDYNTLVEDDIVTDNANLKAIISDMFERDVTSSRTTTFITKDLPYRKGLLINNRYLYLKDKISQVEDNPNRRYELLLEVLSIYFFDYFDFLNNHNYNYECEDMFRPVIDFIFDSDSYDEVLTKIKKISSLAAHYDENPDLAASFIDIVFGPHRDDYKKEVVAGITLEYPDNGNNVTQKPTKISKRLAEICALKDLLPKDVIASLNDGSFGPYDSLTDFNLNLKTAISEKSSVAETEPIEEEKENEDKTKTKKFPLTNPFKKK